MGCSSEVKEIANLKLKIKPTELPAAGFGGSVRRANLSAPRALRSLTGEDERTGTRHFIGCR
jgi:hypothetical protein